VLLFAAKMGPKRFYQPDSALHRDLTAPVAPAPAD
jgi:hypothetical protein